MHQSAVECFTVCCKHQAALKFFKTCVAMKFVDDDDDDDDDDDLRHFKPYWGCVLVLTELHWHWTYAHPKGKVK